MAVAILYLFARVTTVDRAVVVDPDLQVHAFGAKTEESRALSLSDPAGDFSSVDYVSSLAPLTDRPTATARLTARRAYHCSLFVLLGALAHTINANLEQ